MQDCTLRDTRQSKFKSQLNFREKKFSTFRVQNGCLRPQTLTATQFHPDWHFYSASNWASFPGIERWNRFLSRGLSPEDYLLICLSHFKSRWFQSVVSPPPIFFSFAVSFSGLSQTVLLFLFIYLFIFIVLLLLGQFHYFLHLQHHLNPLYQWDDLMR